MATWQQYRSGVEISSGLANFYCGFDLLDSATSDEAGGSSSVGTIERKKVEDPPSSTTTRAPPNYLLCQACLEDVFAFVPQSKVVPFLEKLRDSNSMTKVRVLLANANVLSFYVDLVFVMLIFYWAEIECGLCDGMD